LEVAADWHELMIPQCIMWQSIPRTSEQLDPHSCSATSGHTTASISHKLLLHLTVGCPAVSEAEFK